MTIQCIIIIYYIVNIRDNHKITSTYKWNKNIICALFLQVNNKDIYNLQWAQDSINNQAGHFFDCRTKQIEELSKNTLNPPIILCPYDAELYGHWWYEGPQWLYILAKKIYYDNCNFELTTPSEYIEKYPTMQISNICRSSWGANGYSYVWLNQSNDYILLCINMYITLYI